MCDFADSKGIKVGATVHFFEKIEVKGAGMHPLYKWLKEQRADPACWGREIKWNFTKFVLDREGRVALRIMHFNKIPERRIEQLLYPAVPEEEAQLLKPKKKAPTLTRRGGRREPPHDASDTAQAKAQGVVTGPPGGEDGEDGAGSMLLCAPDNHDDGDDAARGPVGLSLQ